MHVQWRYLLAGVAVATLSFVIGLEAEIATARPGSEPTTIDRALKGDRLTPGLRPSVAPARQPKLLDGCESSFSTIRSSPMREVAGRCLAAAPAGDSRLG